MKYLYTLYVWLIGGLLFFILMIFSIAIFSFISSKKFIPIFRSYLRLIFSVIFVRVKREFAEPIDFSKRYIYMPNHVSILDAPICAAYMPEFITALEAAEHFNWPIYGKLTRSYGNIPIQRRSIHQSLKSFDIAKETIVNKNSMVIFPESSRTEDGDIGRFKKLPFQLAKQANVGIVPVGMSGVYTLNKKHSFLFKPSSLKLKFGKIIPASVVADLTIEELAEMTRKEVEKLKEYN
jgi:1-acyl-sn-glycerol-3-phosphate acyltransferase